ncbi:dihydrofolate reductase family protein [Tropicimonas isoalkanivorans]|uniref:Dihydrofolate reductase n=1 Tax=Tropicimonas isoalkanivorans TaxID=441112 RepID=A0A1I1IB60_9RHOB|nr:dihydrofolate reductase family protein [Tropicimonas isoalkanivorans]SFC33447.1 Dihydrofolate reductase [Tropicimonas isoalkanivorans]
MRKIRIIEHMSLDGVIQAPGAPDEDGDYAHGGWAMPFSDPAVGEAIEAVYGQSFDLLIGRRTYDIFGSYWPKRRGPLADSLNGATKFVATHGARSLDWGPAEALGADIVAGIRRVKATEGPDLVTWGSSTLTPVLVEQDLADEIVLLVAPVLLGAGKRFFREGFGARELRLVGIERAGSGVIISRYQPAGPLRTGSYDRPVD